VFVSRIALIFWGKGTSLPLEGQQEVIWGSTRIGSSLTRQYTKNLDRDKLFWRSVTDEDIFYDIYTCGLYYKPITINHDDSSVISRLVTSLIDDARVVIYDHHMFIVQAARNREPL